MSEINLGDFDSLKNNIYTKRSDIKEEQKKEKPLRKLQKEIIKSRINCDLSQQELADKIGTSQSVISKLENSDDYNPNLKTLIKVSQALDKTLNISLV